MQEIPYSITRDHLWCNWPFNKLSNKTSTLNCFSCSSHYNIKSQTRSTSKNFMQLSVVYITQCSKALPISLYRIFQRNFNCLIPFCELSPNKLSNKVILSQRFTHDFHHNINYLTKTTSKNFVNIHLYLLSCFYIFPKALPRLTSSDYRFWTVLLKVLNQIVQFIYILKCT